MYGELTCNLVGILLLPDLLLAHDLHPAQEACQLVAHEHHLPELAFAHLLPYCEVSLGKLLLLQLSRSEGLYASDRHEMVSLGRLDRVDNRSWLLNASLPIGRLV